MPIGYGLRAAVRDKFPDIIEVRAALSVMFASPSSVWMVGGKQCMGQSQTSRERSVSFLCCQPPLPSCRITSGCHVSFLSIFAGADD